MVTTGAEASKQPSAGGRRIDALDGLRGLAWFGVILHHHAAVLVPSAHPLISVFFTLSGFLVGGDLLRRLERGRLAPTDWLARRWRRLWPAAAITVAGITVGWRVWTDGRTLVAPRAELLAALANVSNWYALDTGQGYGALNSPVDHFWSLAVEEQVYLLVPLVCWALWRVLRRRTGAIAIACGLLSIGGFAWATHLALTAGIDRAYLGTDARFAEVLVGVGVAAALHGRRLGPSRLWDLLAAALVATLGVIVWTGPGYTPSLWTSGRIPGACAITAILIATWVRPVPGRAAQVVGAAPLAWLGRISYATYLIHWPIFIVLDERRLGVRGLELFLARITVTLLAGAALHYGTDWLRSAPKLRKPRATFAFAGVGSLTLAGWLTVTTATALVPVGLENYRFDDVSAASELTIPPPPSTATTVLTTPGDSTPPPPPTTVAPHDPRLALVGDSVLWETLDHPEGLPKSLQAQGWQITDIELHVGGALCSDREYKGNGSEVRVAWTELAADWFATNTAPTVLMELGSGDVIDGPAPDSPEVGGYAACLEQLVAAAPASITWYWVVPQVTSWWPDLDRDEVTRRAALYRASLDDLVAAHPNIQLLDWPARLAAEQADLAHLYGPDGVHLTIDGIAEFAAYVSESIGPP